LNRWTSYEYYADGKLKQVWDPIWRKRQFEYDGLGRQVLERWLKASSGDSYETVAELSFNYDAADNLVHSSRSDDAELVNGYQYDSLNRMKVETKPFGVTLQYSYSPGVHQMWVMATETYAGGRQVQSTSKYDANKRLVMRDVIDSGQLVALVKQEWRRDLPYNVTYFGYQDGGLEEVMYSRYNYDSLARTESLLYAFEDGRRHSIERFEYKYEDGAGRLTREERKAYVYEWETVTLPVEPGHAGPPTTVERQRQYAAFSYTNTFTYDAIGQLPSPSGTFGYDRNGNRKDAWTELDYDNRVLNNNNYKFVYNGVGNLIQKTKQEIVDPLFGADYQQVTGPHYNYYYDHANRLIKVDQFDLVDGVWQLSYVNTYRYDAEGNRVEEKHRNAVTDVVESWTRFVVSRGEVHAELNGHGEANTLTIRYLRSDATDQLWARVDRVSGVPRVLWYVTDRQNSVIAMVDSARNIVKRREYDAFGQLTENWGGDAFFDRWRYTGREMDTWIGMQYHRARYYDLEHGRWISRDPLGFAVPNQILIAFVAEIRLYGIRRFEVRFAELL